MDVIRRALNFRNPAIFLGFPPAVGGLVGTIVHGRFHEQLLSGLIFLIFGWLYEFTRNGREYLNRCPRTTYTEFLLQYHVTCSCCGEPTQPSGAFVSTCQQTVTGVQCLQCEDACTQWRNVLDERLWDKTCEIEVCSWEESLDRNPA